MENDEFESYLVDLNADCSCGCMDGDRFHKIYHFPNEHGASVVSGPKNMIPGQGQYRLLVLKFHSYFEYDVLASSPIVDGTLECEDWSIVQEALGRIARLPADEGP